MQKNQRHQLHALLEYVWVHSPFYRDFYSSHGIDGARLRDVAVTDLPLLPKKLLIENFDRAVTDQRLKRSELERWFEEHQDPRQRFAQDLVVIHGSGTSGDVGIFAYNQREWQIADATIAGRLPPPDRYPASKTRIAFLVAAHGHFATVSMALSTLGTVYETLIVSPLDPIEQTLAKLSSFQPDRLHGYSSSVAELAQLCIAGRLDIRPKRVLVGGDKLTSAMEADIRDAWDAAVHVVYAASESKYIAIRNPGQEHMTVMDDLNVLEVLDAENHQVLAGEDGRVVLTNLYNRTLPLLRYELNDYATMGSAAGETSFSTILDIQGRANDALPIQLADRKTDTIHPVVLTTLYAPGLDKFQFVSRGPENFTLEYVSTNNLDQFVRLELQGMLDRKGAVGTKFDVRRVPEIPNDRKTGKLRLVRLEGSAAAQERTSITPLSGVSPQTATAVLPRTYYRVVGNDAGQYSIWPDGKEIASSWMDSGMRGSKSECLSYINQRRLSERIDDPGDVGYLFQTLFEERVKRVPEKCALVCDGRFVTYEELNAEVNRLTHFLDRFNVGPDSIVAVCLPRSVQLVIGILSALKSGAAWLAIDPDQPKNRQEHILRDAAPTLLITQESIASVVPRHWGRTLIIEQFAEQAANYSTENRPICVTGANLAYLMYTSGSTGHPKATALTHSNLAQNVRSMRFALGITADDIYLHAATFTFSSSVRQLMVPLSTGATVALATAADIQKPMGLLEIIKAKSVTTFDTVPSYWRSCIQILADLHPIARAELLDNVLQRIVLTGEPLPLDLPERWRQYSRKERVINMYGQTETTGTVSTHISDQTKCDSVSVPIGKPIAGLEMYIMNATQELVPVGEPGEIYIGGPTLGRGYLNRPELTADRFVPDAAGTGTRLYKTGDRARYRLNGTLEFLGRSDDQIKIRGIRIEPGEIEATLRQHPAIEESAVIGIDTASETKLAAYFTSQTALPPTDGELRAYLKNRLPAYMIPAAFLKLDSLPRTHSGKLNRRAFPVPEFGWSARENPYVSPRGTMEQKLAQIWSEVLSKTEVGIDDDFFNLGGHSLSVIQMISRIQRAFHVELSVPAVFQAPTIRDMVVMIAKMQSGLFALSEGDALLRELESMSDDQLQGITTPPEGKAEEVTDIK